MLFQGTIKPGRYYYATPKKDATLVCIVYIDGTAPFLEVKCERLLAPQAKDLVFLGEVPEYGTVPAVQ